MVPTVLNAEAARLREDELRAASADAHTRPAARPPTGAATPARLDSPRRRRRPVGLPSPVTIRWAGAADIPALHKLARLDEAVLPRAPTLVAEREGEILAALPIGIGAPAIADPFRRTADLVEVLELRAAQLARSERPARSRRRWSWAHLPARRTA